MLELSINYTPNVKGEVKVKEAIQVILQKAMFKMEELAIDYATSDTSDLRLHISVFPEILANKYKLTSHMPYSEAMEYGTKPFYAPIKPLKAWAGRKLGDENAAYAVRAKIAKVGIRAHPFMRPAFYEVVNFWVDQFAEQELGKLNSN